MAGRFADCTHTGEPGCGVLAAVASGALRREAWHLSASEHERRQKMKSFTKRGDEVKNKKRG